MLVRPLRPAASASVCIRASMTRIDRIQGDARDARRSRAVPARALGTAGAARQHRAGASRSRCPARSGAAALGRDRCPGGADRRRRGVPLLLRRRGSRRLLTERDPHALRALGDTPTTTLAHPRSGGDGAPERWGDRTSIRWRRMAEWANGSWLERRTAAAALCEPVLLTDGRRVRVTLDVLEAATEPIATAEAAERRSDAYKALRKGLGYCWSVAVAAAPETGRPALESLVMRAVNTGDGDLRWIALRTCANTVSRERIRTGWTSCWRGSDDVHRSAGRVGEVTLGPTGQVRGAASGDGAGGVLSPAPPRRTKGPRRLSAD